MKEKKKTYKSFEHRKTPCSDLVFLVDPRKLRDEKKFYAGKRFLTAESIVRLSI